MNNRIRNDLARLPAKGPTAAPEGWEGSYFLFPDFVAFDGHFPDYPILPAFAQVVMAQVLLEKALAGPLRLVGIPSAKFTAQARPQDELSFHCREIPGSAGPARTYDCRVVSRGPEGERQAASFRLLLEPQEDNRED